MVKAGDAPSHVALGRAARLRLVVVGLLCALALVRVAPDGVRLVYPLGAFPYTTDGDGVVRATDPHASGGPAVGDRLRIDRVPYQDRKRGLGLTPYTFDDTPRRLPYERAGRLEHMHLATVREDWRNRITALVRILLAFITIGGGAILFLVRPKIVTAAFFVSTLGFEAPSTYLEWLMPMPWRAISGAIGAAFQTIDAPALLLFVFCLIDGEDDASRERIAAWISAGFAALLGGLQVWAFLAFTFGARAVEHQLATVRTASVATSLITALLFAVAFLRARGGERRAVFGIASAFVVSLLAHAAVRTLPRTGIQPWQAAMLETTAVLPVIAVWVAVVRERFFHIDLAGRRAIVYVALTAGIVGTIAAVEDVGTYLFYSNTDIQYGFLIFISLALGTATGKIKEAIERVIDRFIFRERAAQRVALEFLAYRMLEAEDYAQIEHALLNDARDALDLAFCGIFVREADGSFTLGRELGWPPDLPRTLPPDDPFAAAITRSRGVLSFSGADADAVRRDFPGGRLGFAAPLFRERRVGGIVVYGPNAGGRDLDPREHELLVRVVAHATLAMHEIELQRLRGEVAGTGAGEPVG